MFYRIQMMAIISQQPTAAYPKRGKTLTYRFFNSYEASNSWREMTDMAKVTVPKKIKVIDQNSRPLATDGTNINVGAGVSPLFLRGDSIIIKAGYRFRDIHKNEVLSPADLDGTPATIFNGFITNVGSGTPIVL